MTYKLGTTQRLLASMWSGPAKRLVRGLVRRLRRGHRTVWLGPLQGVVFKGQLAHMAGVYELDVQKLFLAQLKSGDVFYDVGANVGFLTVLGSRLVGDGGQVYAFEPLPENQDRLKSVISDNTLKNVHLEPKAVSDSDGTAMLGSVEGVISTPSLNASESKRSLPGFSTFEVETITIDSFAAANRPPSFIKMDVEGVEGMVMGGAKKTLTQSPAPRWLIEIHNAENDAQVTAALKEAGYELTFIDSAKKNKKYPCHILAAKP